MEERIETMENTENQDLTVYCDDYDLAEAENSGVGKVLLIGGAIVAAGVGLAVAKRKKIKKWLDDRTLAKAEKIIAKREADEYVEVIDAEVIDDETEE